MAAWSQVQHELPCCTSVAASAPLHGYEARLYLCSGQSRSFVDLLQQRGGLWLLLLQPYVLFQPRPPTRGSHGKAELDPLLIPLRGQLDRGQRSSME